MKHFRHFQKLWIHLLHVSVSFPYRNTGSVPDTLHPAAFLTHPTRPRSALCPARHCSARACRETILPHRLLYRKNAVESIGNARHHSTPPRPSVLPMQLQPDQCLTSPCFLYILSLHEKSFMIANISLFLLETFCLILIFSEFQSSCFLLSGFPAGAECLRPAVSGTIRFKGG